jgi:hypothetical protein
MFPEALISSWKARLFCSGELQELSIGERTYSIVGIFEVFVGFFPAFF